ncbi:hypothetical protein [Umezawaea sp. Da 62-37]|uniref:hypothetical protein n=1 Tax=Umezawaea sp. Da 62-37 TaxID=3075927 RepID=UPI0028F720A5|nr:hypothetical protein [Umezawaea sp. Da 62-37]WNV89822.1 hypothetical protein RM788_16430 [Umezawaea sp. Da 62-37]
MRTQRGPTLIPWPLVAMAIFAVGLVFASVAIGHQLDTWQGPAYRGNIRDRTFDEASMRSTRQLYGGAVISAALLVVASPFVALRRRWAAVVTTCLAVVSVPMGILFGMFEPSSRDSRNAYPDSDWASFCSATAAPLIVIGAIGTLTALFLRGLRERPAPPVRPAPGRVDRA